MLGSIKNLQIIVHLVLMGVIVPANAEIFFGALFDMIAFDPIDVTWIINPMFSLSDIEQGLDEEFEALGYQSAYFLTNLGSLFLVVIVQLVLIPMHLSVWACKPCCNKARRYSANHIDKCLWNGILTFIDGTFLVLCIMGMINLQK